VSFIKDQHLKAILRQLVEIESRRIVSRDHGPDLAGIGGEQLAADRNLARNVEFLFQFLHCGPSSLGQTISVFDSLERTISSLMTRPALMVLPRPTSSASSVTGKRRQKVMRLLTGAETV
jgi:hypothetical protein